MFLLVCRDSFSFCMDERASEGEIILGDGKC